MRRLPMWLLATIWLAVVAWIFLLVAIVPARAATPTCEQDTVGDNCSHVSIFGHRGRQWKTNTNENTGPAFEADLKHGTGFESDAWVLRDGRPVIFHDLHLARVIDPASFPPGVNGQSEITSLNTAQFRALRTKGGQPLWTVKHLIRWAGRHHVTGMIENKYAMLPPETTAAWIHHWKAPVWIYQTQKCTRTDDGKLRVIHPEIAAYGIRVGAKYLGGCRATPEQLAEGGYSFVIGAADMLTSAYNNTAHRYGLETGNFDSGQREVWTRLTNAGVDYLLVPHVARAARWLS